MVCIRHGCHRKCSQTFCSVANRIWNAVTAGKKSEMRTNHISNLCRTCHSHALSISLSCPRCDVTKTSPHCPGAVTTPWVIDVSSMPSENADRVCVSLRVWSRQSFLRAPRGPFSLRNIQHWLVWNELPRDLQLLANYPCRCRRGHKGPGGRWKVCAVWHLQQGSKSQWRLLL